MASHDSNDPPNQKPPAPAFSGLQWEIPGAAPDPTAAEHPFAVADQARYEPGAEVGIGGMGRVYAAHDRRLRRQVAVKEVRLEVTGDAAARLAQEAWITAQLDHPGVVPVYDAGLTTEGRLFYVMRLVRGQSLADAIAQAQTDLDRRKLLRHFLAACQAVAYAHSVGIIHRDLKPSNVLVGGFGETQVMDWGLARPVQRDAGQGWAAVVPAAHVAQTQQGMAVGTPRYMSPEQASGGGVDPRSDVWSLGVVLYEILAGVPPYTGDTPQEVLEKVVTRPPPPLPAAPPELAAVVARALCRDPGGRYPDAGALAADVARFLDGRPVEVYDYTPLELLQRFLAAWRLPLGVGLLIAVAALVAVVLAWQDAEHARQEVQLALQRSDESIQQVLLTQARVALSVDARAEAEILAASALTIADSPEAWGVLASFAAAPRPQLLERVDLPSCDQASYSSTGAVRLCLEKDLLSLQGAPDFTPRWTRPVPSLVSQLLLTADGAVGILSTSDHEIWAVDTQDGSMQILTTGYTLPERPIASLSPRWVGGFNSHLAMLLDLESGQLSTLQPCNGHLASVAVSAQGRLGYVCDGEGLSLQSLGAGEGTPKQLIPTQVASSKGAQGPWIGCFSAQGERFAIGSLDGRVEVVDLRLGESVEVASVGAGMIRSLALDATGELVAVAVERGGTRLWAPGRADPMLRLPGNHSRLLWGTDGTLLTVSQAYSRWQLPHRKGAWELDLKVGLSGVEFSPDSQTLLLATGQDAQLWSVLDARRLHTWLPPEPAVTKDVAFSADGQEALIASMKVSGLARFDAQHPASLSALDATGPMRRLGSLGPRWVWGLPWGNGPLLWDRQTGEANRRLIVPDARMFEGESSFNGEFAALLSEERALYLLRASPEPAVERLLTDVSAWATDVTEDGSRIALADSDAIWVIDVPSRQTILTIPVGDRTPLDVAFSADGRLLAVGDLLGGTQIRSTEDGALVALLRGHSERVVSINFSPDGRFLATASWDKHVRLWGLDILQQDPRALVQSIQQGWGMTLEEALASEIW